VDVVTRATIWPETIPLIRRKSEAAHGRYRTERIILEIYGAVQRASESCQPHHTCSIRRRRIRGLRIRQGRECTADVT
jgi:hypothetical protein